MALVVFVVFAVDVVAEGVKIAEPKSGLLIFKVDSGGGRNFKTGVD